MDKFKYLLGYGLKKRVGRKAFIISNIVILILLILVINLPNLINLFDNGSDINDTYNIEVYNSTDKESFSDDLKIYLNTGLDEEVFKVSLMTEEFNEDNFFKESESETAITISGLITNPEISIYTDDLMLYSNLSRVIEIILINYQIEDYSAPVVNLVLPPDYENPEENMILSSMMSILILPMFMLVIMATQFVGVDIIEEKSTKAIETIISSVPANTHFFSKIISSILFVVIQGALLLLYGALGILISKAFPATISGGAEMLGGVDGNILSYIAELMPNWPAVLAITVFFMISGTLMYLVIAALFASMAVTQEDYQQFQTPLMLILLGSFYSAIFAPMGGTSTFAKVLSYIPIIAPMLTPVALASGMISILDAVISLVIVIVTLVVLTYVITPVYKVSILSYDQTKFFKRVKDYFKKGFQKNNHKK